MSAAYYAVFHHMIAVATEHLLPSTGATTERLLLSRNFQHGAMLRVCERVGGTSTLPKATGWAVSNLRNNPDLVDATGTFADLQQARHQADYDHLASFTKPGVLALIDLAKDAIRKLTNLQGSPDLALFVTLLTLETQTGRAS